MSILEKLKEHLDNMSEEEFKKIWDEIGDVGSNGPTAREYLDYLKELRDDTEAD